MLEALEDVTSQILNNPKNKNILHNGKWNKTDTSQVETVRNLINIEEEQNLLLDQAKESHKSQSESKKFKASGNDYFKKKKYVSAIAEYGEGILLANVDSPELSILFANRSACLFHCFKFEDCLQDILAAFKHDYPAALHYKVYERAGLCCVKLARYSKALEYFNKSIVSLKVAGFDEENYQKWEKILNRDIKQLQSMSSKVLMDNAEGNNNNNNNGVKFPYIMPKRHGVFRCLSSDLKVQCSSQYGRYVSANTDIRAGETVSIEMPFASVLFPQYYKTHCMCCFKKITYVFPCRRCSGVAYCSELCSQSDWELYHKYECNLMCYFDVKYCARLGHLAARMFIKVRLMILQEFVTMYKTESKGAENGQRDLKQPLDNEEYKQLQQLVYHEGKRDIQTSLQLAILAIFLKNFVTSSGVLHDTLVELNAAQILEQEAAVFELENYVIMNLLKFIQMIQCNGFTVPVMMCGHDLTASNPADIGMALYLQSSLFNHSCDPDLELSFHGNHIVAHSVKQIAQGSQVYCDYGYVFYTDEKSRRQKELETQYLFQCDCRACVKDWPLMANIESKVPKFKCTSCQMELDMNNGDRSTINCSNINCNQVTNIINILQSLAKSHQAYQGSMELAMSGKRSEALPGLLAHLEMMERHLCLPWREYYSCQATIKQIYRLSGNTDA